MNGEVLVNGTEHLLSQTFRHLPWAELEACQAHGTIPDHIEETEQQTGGKFWESHGDGTLNHSKLGLQAK